MTQDHTNFPMITEVALLIAYDNGMINREEPHSKFIEKLDEHLGADGVYYEDLQKMENWIATLSQEGRETLAYGEHSEMVELQNKAPNPEQVMGFFDGLMEI